MCDGGPRCRGEGRVLGVAGEPWGQMEGNVSEQDGWREVGEKEGEGAGVHVKGHQQRQAVGDGLEGKAHGPGEQHWEGGSKGLGC